MRDGSTAHRSNICFSARLDVFPQENTLNFDSVNDLIIAIERFASVPVFSETLLAEYIKYLHLPNTPADSEVTPVHASNPKGNWHVSALPFFPACVFEVSCTAPVMRVLSDEQLMVLRGVFSP